MSEGAKTGALAVVAGLAALLAFTTSTRNFSTTKANGQEKVNQVVFEKFTDPVNAASLKILRYDKDKEEYVEFEVSKDRKSGIWTIPSSDGYPADATKQMSDAANLFVGLKALAVASEKRDEQSLYGVVEPDKQKAEQGGDGVGMLVQMRDEKGDTLADLIIGKSDEKDKKKRFVRIPNEDVIYVCEIDTNPLSTDFKQWIESDLLKLSSNDVDTLGIRDYALVPTTQGVVLTRNYEADVAFSVTNGQWQAKRIASYDKDKDEPTQVPVGPDQQLNSTKLNDMKSALDSLKIANVLKKPAGLAANLKAESSLLSNTDSLRSLQRRGFFPNPSASGEGVDIFAMSGELQVSLKDGVQYLLRFGSSAGADISSIDKEQSGDKAPDAQDTVSINRFLLVTTQLDESRFPAPELERVPETVEELKAMEAAKAAAANPITIETPALDNPTNSAEPTVPATEGTVPEEPKTAPEASADAPAADAPAGNTATPGTPEAPAEPAKAPESSSASIEVPVGKFTAVQDPAPAPAAVQPPADAQKPEPTEQEWKERLEAERERITKDNQRKIDQRNDRIAAAKKKVAELNARFADWYYVISEAEYKRLRIPLNDLIQSKAGSGPIGPSPSGLPGFPGGFELPGNLPGN